MRFLSQTIQHITVVSFPMSNFISFSPSLVSHPLSLPLLPSLSVLLYFLTSFVPSLSFPPSPYSYVPFSTPLIRSPSPSAIPPISVTYSPSPPPHPQPSPSPSPSSSSSSSPYPSLYLSLPATSPLHVFFLSTCGAGKTVCYYHYWSNINPGKIKWDADYKTYLREWGCTESVETCWDTCKSTGCNMTKSACCSADTYQISHNYSDENYDAYKYCYYGAGISLRPCVWLLVLVLAAFCGGWNDGLGHQMKGFSTDLKWYNFREFLG